MRFGSKFFSASREELLKLNEDEKSPTVKIGALASLTVFVSLGVAQAISIRYSVGVNGSINYDASAAVTAAEFIKLAVALAWLVIFNRDSIPTSREEVPRSWVYESITLLIVAIFFAIQNQLAFLVVEKLGASLFMILGNLKIVFTCVFMHLMLGKKFSILQWSAVAMLTISAMVLKFPVLLRVERGQAQADGDRNLMIGFILMLLSTCSSGLSSVVNELVLKKESSGPQMPFMAKNAVLYGWGFVLNLVVWNSMGVYPFFSWLSGQGLFPVLCMTGMGLACSVVLRYLDNIYRCFGACAQVLLTVTLSRFILPPSLREEPFGIFYACSLLLLAQAIVIYQNHESPRLLWYVAQASFGTIFVCLICVGIDTRNTALETQ